MSVLETNASLDTSTKCQKYLKNLLDVSSSQTSWSNSGCFSSNPVHSFRIDLTIEVQTIQIGPVTTVVPWPPAAFITQGHSFHRCTCHYLDPWWKMTYHDDNQGNHQRYPSKEKNAKYRCSIIFDFLMRNSIKNKNYSISVTFFEGFWRYFSKVLMTMRIHFVYL